MALRTNTKYLMACGCAPQGYNKDRDPICVIHDCYERMPIEIDLAERVAKCYCGRSKESSVDLPFFKYEPLMENDSYYCGCRGWD